MIELIAFSLSYVNIIPTALLVFIFVYWATVLLGFLDLNFLDIEVETDADVDLNVDLDVDVDLHAEVEVDADVHANINADPTVSHGGGVGSLNHILVFFNLGQVPFMLWLSFVILPMWAISVLVTYYLGVSWFLISLALLIPNIIVSFFIAKFVTMPFVKIFGKLDKEVNTNASLAGKVGKVRLPVSPGKIGQAEVMHNATPILLNIIAAGETNIGVGHKVLVIHYDQEDKTYLVEPYDE